MEQVRNMLDRVASNWALVFVLGSLAILITAWTFQYGFGYQPCELCLYQRYPYMLAAAVGAVAFFTKRRPDLGTRRAARGFLVLMTFLMFLDAAIAGYHVGVEQKLWEGPMACSSFFSGPMTADKLPELSVRCDEAAWSLFGISMAGYNFLLALGLAAFGIYAFRRTRKP